jgi:4-hydroxybenzoate polyprenyltransferase
VQLVSAFSMGPRGFVHLLDQQLNRLSILLSENIHMAQRLNNPNWFRSLLISVYLLELVGASAITALGCVACKILQIDWRLSAPLWFSGYLLVYNLDHLYSDPADSLNTPQRFCRSARLRWCRFVLVCLSGAILLFWPVVTGRLWLLIPLATALSVFHFYSRPIPSTDFRLKNLSYVKSLIAPGVIAVVLVIWPVLESGRALRQKEWLIFFWIFLVLAMNSLVFDYRDIIGDRLTGTKTIPTLLGHKRTRGLLNLLAGTLVWTTVALSLPGPAGGLMPGALLLGCIVLLVSLRLQMSPLQLSLLADLLLLLPAIVELLT